MPRISDLSVEQWKEVEILAVAGMTYKSLGEKYDIEPGTIAVRAHREEWAVPARVDKLRKELAENQLSQTNPTKEVGFVKESNVASQIAENIEEMGQKSRILALRGLLPRFTKTFAEDSELLSQPIENWKDAGAITNILSKLAGWDRPQSTVQVNVWGAGDVQNAIPVESEPVDDEDP